MCQRIEEEDVSFYQSNKEFKPEIVKCYVRRYKRTRLTGLQKKYYAKLYRIGKLKKKPYSQVWKYKDDIKKMEKLQKQYLFLVRHDVHSMEQLAATVLNLTDKKKESSAEKTKVFRARKRYKELFDTVAEMDLLKGAESNYRRGDEFFLEEHNRWLELEKILSDAGYSYEEVKQLQEHYKEEVKLCSERESAAKKELNLGNTIWKDMVAEDESEAKDIAEDREQNKDKIITRQPRR